MPKLQLVKVTKKQINLFSSMLVYFNGQKLRAQRRAKLVTSPQDYIHPISLSGIYESLKITSPHKPIVKMAANVFFERAYRGNSITKQCSGWRIREHPRLNPQIRKLLPELFEANAEFIQQVSSVVMGNDNSVTITTKFQFQNPEQASTFAALMQALSAEESNDA